MRCERYILQKLVKFASSRVSKSFEVQNFSKFFVEHQDDCNEDARIYSLAKNRTQPVTERVRPFLSHLTASNKFRPRYRCEYPDIVSAHPVHTRQAYGLFNFVSSRVRFIRRRIQTAIARLYYVYGIR